nr:zinc finger protein 267-like isoform X2 [Leptinotarsa decemlineata]
MDIQQYAILEQKQESAVNTINKSLKIKTENHCDCAEDSLMINIGSKEDQFKNEFEINVFDGSLKTEMDVYSCGSANEKMEISLNRIKEELVEEEHDTEDSESCLVEFIECKREPIKIEEDIGLFHNNVKREIIEEETNEAKASVVIHEKTHTGEKSFQCKVCSESFTRNAQLKLHQVLHVNISDLLVS